jgi:hypothetical protein
LINRKYEKLINAGVKEETRKIGGGERINEERGELRAS